MTESQNRNWNKETQAGGFKSLAEFIRIAVDRSIKKGMVSNDELIALNDNLSGLYNELHHIGINLNQIAKHANGTGEIKGSIDDNLSDLSEIKSELVDALSVLKTPKFKRLSRKEK